MASSQIDGDIADKVRQLASSNPAAYRLFDEFARRERDRAESPIDSIESLAQTDRRTAFQLMKDMDALGLGSAVIGRRGATTRFVWKFGIRAIGLAAQTKATSIAMPLSAGDEGGHVQSADQQTVGNGFIEHKFVLRPHFNASFKLPSDLTIKEAERLSAFINSIPF